MKLYTPLLCLLVIVQGCSLFKPTPRPNNILFPDALVLSYPVSTRNIEAGLFKNGTDSAGRPLSYQWLLTADSLSRDSFASAPFVNRMMNKVLTGEILAYQPEPFYPDANSQHTISRNAIKDKFEVKIDTIVFINSKNEHDTVFPRRDIDKNRVKTLHCIEEWFLNDSAFDMQKKVNDILPVITTYPDTDTLHRFPSDVFLFRLPNAEKDQHSSENQEFICTSVYEFPLITPNENNLYFSASPYWNWHNREQFIHIILQKVLTGQKTAYDFFTSDSLPPATILKRFDALNDTIYRTNAQGDTITKVIEKEIYYPEIKSVIFIEDWYASPDNMHITKNVRAVALVRHYFESAVQNTEVKEVVFTVFFD